MELSPEDTARQITDTAKLGTRVLWLGHNLTAANTQWIIAHAHQMGLVTYGEFVSTPYKVGIEAGVDALLHMGRYELGVIPDELQRPWWTIPKGPAATPPTTTLSTCRPTIRICATTPIFWPGTMRRSCPPSASIYLRLPEHRNLWKEPAAKLLDPAHMFDPPDRTTGEMIYPAARLGAPPAGRDTALDGRRTSKRRPTSPRCACGASTRPSSAAYPALPCGFRSAGASAPWPGISMHTELEMLVRLGLSPREALAAATNNYAIQFGWNELGQIAPGRRADILVVDADPTVNIWNVRRISTLIVDGNVIDRDALLNLKK